MHRQLLGAALALATLTAAAQEPKPLSPGEQADALRSAEATGLAIYRHDHAAAVATDAAIKQRNLAGDARVRGWVTEERDGGIVVTFIDQTPAALYRVPVSKEGVAGEVTALDAPAPLTPYEDGASKARAIALAANFQRCAQTYNSVVLPSATPGAGWVVYLIPGATQSDVVPIGGTQRIEVRGQGTGNPVAARLHQELHQLEGAGQRRGADRQPPAGRHAHGGSRLLEPVDQEADVRRHATRGFRLGGRRQQDQAARRQGGQGLSPRGVAARAAYIRPISNSTTRISSTRPRPPDGP